MTRTETFKEAFTDPPAIKLAGVPVTNLKLTSPWMSYGLPYEVACAKHVKETFRASRIYIIASGSLTRNTNKVDKLINALGSDNVVGLRKGMTSHSPWSEILDITNEAREQRTDCIVTLGAGSLTDAAKIIVLALANDIRTRKQLAQYSIESERIPENLKEPSVPLITIPTSLSGGEYYSLAGGTDPETNHKQAFLHSGMGSKLIILDPELCLSTPEYHWLSTGVRSMDHCLEALCSLEATPKSDQKAEQGLRLLVPSLLRCKIDANDVEARGKCQMAVNLAMDNVRAGIPMGGSHAIGHQLGPLGVPHGVTSCIMCPAVMKYNMKHGQDPEIARRQAKVRDILWSEADVAGCFRSAGLTADADLGDLVDCIIRTLSLPRTLSEMGIGDETIEGLSVRALHDQWSPTNPVPLVKAEQVKEILLACR
ncbi:alcohol dehydrogenase [Phaeosphaeria sp. MPI-PUGE-AT-0046c]|nr:alcohol dehydrogenase [Phaeosphaeria sp. MPI-PUGE-AT-0046c]